MYAGRSNARRSNNVNSSRTTAAYYRGWRLRNRLPVELHRIIDRYVNQRRRLPYSRNHLEAIGRVSRQRRRVSVRTAVARANNVIAVRRRRTYP